MKSNKVFFAAVLLGSISLVALTRTSAASETAQGVSTGNTTQAVSTAKEPIHSTGSPSTTGKTGTTREGQSTSHVNSDENSGGSSKSSMKKKDPKSSSTSATHNSGMSDDKKKPKDSGTSSINPDQGSQPK